MVKVLRGDIFKSKAHTLVNTVNCVGIMGKGLALEFKKRYPDMFKEYVQFCRKGMIKLGKPHLFKRTVLPWILMFPTKQDWRSVSRLSDIKAGMRYLLLNYKEWGIESIAVPPLGCGLGELEWRIVGKTLYRLLGQLQIPVELYAPYETPDEELTAEFLEEPSSAQLVEEEERQTSHVEPGFIAIIEVLNRLEKIPYRWPIGRVAFQKITYFGTLLGFNTGLEFKRSSFGPFSPHLKAKLTKLVNNGLIEEEQSGSMFKIRVGTTFNDARKTYLREIKTKECAIERLTDLFCRLNTKQAEVAATIHFAWVSMKNKPHGDVTEENVLNEVMQWKQKHRPPYDRLEIMRAIRNLAVHGWLKVKPSGNLTKEIEPTADL